MSPSTPHPITTTGTTPSVTTEHEPNQSIADWVDRHDKAVAGCTVNGNTLTTAYTSSQGAESVQTQRLTGESDALFLSRHRTDYLEAMVVWPPIH